MNIDIEKYISEEEIKQIISEEIREYVRNHFRDKNDMERIFSNSAYHVLWKEVDSLYDGNMSQIIKDKIISIISSDTPYLGIFRKKDVWDRDESESYKIMVQTIKQNTDIIKNNVIDAMKHIPKKEMQSAIKDAVIEKLTKAL